MEFQTGAIYQFQKGTWQAAIHDLIIGTAIGVSRTVWHVFPNEIFYYYLAPIYNELGIKHSRDLIKAAGYPKKNPDDTLKVVVLGYHRTGTMSMYFALEKIGYRTWHSMHLMENGIIATSQDDDLWKPSIQAGKLRMGKLDFNLLVSLGYTATTDLPMGLYYEQLMEEFPDVKFILTSRKDPETWYKSIDTLCTAMVNKIWLNSIKSPAAARLTRYFRWMYTTFTGDESYLTRPFPFPSVDKESSIKSYLEHNRRVREIVPADRLLDFKVEDGWQPLCQFLEIKDCPMEPFPRSNSKIALSAYVASSAITGGIIVLTTTALELVIIVMLLKLMIRPRRGKNRELFARRSSRYVGRNGHSSSFMK